MTNYEFDKLSEIAQHIITHATQKQVEGILSQKGLDIQFSINGVDLSDNFDKLCIAINEQLDRMVHDEAKTIVQNEYSDLIYKIQQASDIFDTVSE